MTHPSKFELDLAALDPARNRPIAQHLEECDECREHVAAVRPLPQTASLPPWVERLGTGTRATAAAPLRPRLPLLVAALTLGLLAFVLYLRTPAEPAMANKPASSSGTPSSSAPSARQARPLPAPSSTAHNRAWPRQSAAALAGPVPSASAAPSSSLYLAAKGAPRVSVLVKRGPRVFVLGAQQAIAPGDRLMLQISPAGYRYAAVFGRVAGKLEALYRGPLPRSGRLAKAWEVDAELGNERVVVVLSVEPPSEQALGLALAGPRTPGALWVQELSLPKEAP